MNNENQNNQDNQDNQDNQLNIDAFNSFKGTYIGPDLMGHLLVVDPEQTHWSYWEKMKKNDKKTKNQ